MGFRWINETIEAECPICHSRGDAIWKVEAASLNTRAANHAVVRYAECQSCRCLFAIDPPQPDYSADIPNAESTQYYVEQLAAIDTIVDPLFALNAAHVRSYLEIGCSFGFALDFARSAFGWDVVGIDPSPLAEVGRAVLDLPIQLRYFDGGAIAANSVDLVVGSEVIEHVPDPHAFIRDVASTLKPNGVLILSTPNSACIEPGASESMVLQSLCPGYHLTVFSLRSLKSLLTGHGFVHQFERTTAVGLTVFASRAPFEWRREGRTDRDLYRSYLSERLRTAAPGSALERGMMSRLLREFSNFALWDRAASLLPSVFAAYRGCGVDLSDAVSCRPRGAPGSLREFLETAPSNVGVVLFCVGQLHRLHFGDAPAAVACYDSARAWFCAVRPILRGFGVVDAEADAFEKRAIESAIVLVARLSPSVALGRFAAVEAAESGTLLDDRDIEDIAASLFIELVNIGYLKDAAMLFARLALDREPIGEAAIGRVRLLFAIAVFDLNHLQDRVGAVAALGRANALLTGCPGVGFPDGLSRSVEQLYARLA